MSRLKLTARIISTLKAPDPSGKQRLHWDSELKGFAILCSGVSNARTYICQRDLPNSGITRRVTVGAVNEISLDVARERAADILDHLRRGIDPKKSKGTGVTLAATLESYLAARKTLRPASVRSYSIVVNRYLAPWRHLPLTTITSEMVENRHRAIVVEVGKSGTRYTGTTTANFAMKTLRILWNFAADRTPHMPPNPVRRLRRQWYAEPRRERIVKIDDMPVFFKAVDALPNKIARDFILLLLFTGLRIGEARALRWEEVDLKNGILHVPAERTKAGRKLDLPMSDFVRDLLIARRAIGNAGVVFPAPSKSGHVRDVQYPLTIVAEQTGIRVSAHDLRRSFLTVAESCDISPLALRALVNHSIGKDVTAGYVQMSVERLREPAQRIADRIKSLCGVVGPAGKNIKKLGSYEGLISKNLVRIGGSVTSPSAGSTRASR
jgi:integrase